MTFYDCQLSKPHILGAGSLNLGAIQNPVYITDLHQLTPQETWMWHQKNGVPQNALLAVDCFRAWGFDH